MSGNKPLVSVIIPAYNHQKYVQETIKSVIDQTYQNIELILIDDGSEDNTWQKIQELSDTCQKRFSRFVAQKQQNQGTSITLNKGVSLCKGKYIAVIASDDVYLPSCLEEQVKIMEENPKIVQTLPDNISIDSEGKTFKGFEWHKKFFTLRSDYWLSRYPSFDLSGKDFHSYKTVLEKDFWSNGFLWRKEALDKFFPIPTVKMSEDYYINLQLAKLGLVKFINKPLFLYRIHDTNTLNRKKYMDIIGTNVRIEEIKQVLKPEQKKWKEILKETWFKEEIKSFGFKNFCVQRVKTEFTSIRRIKIFNRYFMYRKRARYNIPTELIRQLFN
jgi:alpha-1,3-rhamnosyltransferase